jgi:glycine reductase
VSKSRIVHYINQFYAGQGGEDKADVKPEKLNGAVGPGLALVTALGDAGEVVGTVYCGDSYFNENIDKASEEVLEMIKSFNPDIVVVGPGFNAGRYGMACGAVAKIVDEKMGIPVVGGLYEENPGLEIYKRHGYFVPVGNNAAAMRKAIPDMVAIIKKLIAGEAVTEGFFEKGLRVNFFADERGSKRAVDMLLKKIAGTEFTTEYPMPVFDRVAPQAAIKDMKHARIALVSSGGPVPKGNPDRIESSSASKYGKYSLKDITDFTSENGETAHGGYDPVYANEDLDRVLPVDVIKEMVAEGKIGSLHDYWYATVGNGTSVANSKKYAAEIAEQLLADNVSCVILTST